VTARQLNQSAAISVIGQASWSTRNPRPTRSTNMTDVEPHDEQSFGDKAKTWAISALGWLIVAALVFFAINWLFSALAIAFKAVFSLAIVGLMIFGYFKLRPKQRHDKQQAHDQ
jgi:hypothetical protein